MNQEPALFAATIADNIGYGHPDATQDLIEAAAIEANAHDFIVSLPEVRLGYDKDFTVLIIIPALSE